jgi:L-aminopeptidase/D-esterase-like protein
MIVRVNAAKSGAARRFWLYNRRFDGGPSDTMVGFKTGARPKNETRNKMKIMSMEPASLKMFAAALQSTVKRPEKRRR